MAQLSSSSLPIQIQNSWTCLDLLHSQLLNSCGSPRTRASNSKHSLECHYSERSKSDSFLTFYPADSHLQFILPHLMGWYAFANHTKPENTRPVNSGRYGGLSEWSR